MVHPIIDEYFSYNPYHSRSSQFAQEKGLVTNEKNPARTGTTPCTTSPALITVENKSYLSAKQAPVIATTLRPTMQDFSSSSGRTTPTTNPTSPILRPANSNENYSISFSDSQPMSDLRHLSPLSPLKSQEQGNTKKKRRSLSAMAPQAMNTLYEGQPQENIQHSLTAPNSPQHQPQRASYGDPAKIHQFFPELGLENL